MLKNINLAVALQIIFCFKEVDLLKKSLFARLPNSDFNAYFRLLFVALFAVVLWQGLFLLRVDYAPSFIWLLRPFRGHENSYREICWALFGINLLSIFLLRTQSIISRGLFCFVFVLLFSLKYSFGKIDHDNHIWIWASIFLIFYEPSLCRTQKSNALALHLIQATLLAQYFCAGLWKIRNTHFAYPKWSIFVEKPLDDMAYALAERANLPNDLQSFLLDYPVLLSLGYVWVLVFQLFSWLPLVRPGWMMIWGIQALLFHVFSGLFLSIWYWPTILAAVVFLIAPDFFRPNSGNGFF